jgi:uncharacterized SAM-binding protein YcdF (DUF218 family)
MMRALRLLVLLLAFAFVAGFAVFSECTTRAAPPSPPPLADGVVALTGAGGARISTAMALLDQGAATRLLITGVNPSTTDDDVRRIAAGSAEMFDCCVDLDRSARTTVGNASEVAAWARAQGFQSLIVVTSDFHMPRSLLELGRALSKDGVTLHAYPVLGAEVSGRPWWRDATAARRLVVEYAKYLTAVSLGATGLRAPPPAPAASAPA